MTENVLTIQRDGDLRLAVQMMLWGGCRHLPVLDGERIIGVVTEHDIHRAQAESGVVNTPITDVMSRDVLCISPSTELTAASAMMSDARISSLPVVDEGRLVGILTSTDVLAHVARVLNVVQHVKKRVRDVMCTTPRSVQDGQTLSEALLEMVGNEIRHMPVVDREGRLLGILSDRDVRELVGDPVAVLRDDTFAETLSLPVAEVMTANPISAKADEPLQALSWALLDERVGAVPVVDDSDKLVGIVSYVDVLHHALRGLG